MSGHYVCHLRKEGRWVHLGETRGVSKCWIEASVQSRACSWQTTQAVTICRFPTKKWKLSQMRWVSSDLTEVCGEVYHWLSWACHSKFLFNLGHWFCIWLSFSELFPASLCCHYLSLGNPWFSFIWALTTHASARPSSFSIPDSGSWFGCFSDPLFSLQCLILDFKLFLRFGSEKSLINLWWFLYSWNVMNLVFLSDGWSTTTLESVPQNDLPKTWATFIFTTGYQVRPQIYHLALRSHKPF